MSIVKINGKPYKFTEHENELIKKNGLTPGMVAKKSTRWLGVVRSLTCTLWYALS